MLFEPLCSDEISAPLVYNISQINGKAKSLLSFIFNIRARLIFLDLLLTLARDSFDLTYLLL